ncbi:MAG: 30S ribosomal protein S6 [Rickettsiaceae bacterium]|nr:MAG: 30S ribosomal protein S6 [Rickettsiaceae bacterium]
MAFYESIFIIRQDIAYAEVDKIANEFQKIIEDYSGRVVKTEYWGIRTLSYEIANNRKGHYYLLGIEADHKAMKELERKTKLNENVLRFLNIRVDAISSEPSAILKGKNSEQEETVNVTINKENIVPPSAVSVETKQ